MYESELKYQCGPAREFARASSGTSPEQIWFCDWNTNWALQDPDVTDACVCELHYSNFAIIVCPLGWLIFLRHKKT